MDDRLYNEIFSSYYNQQKGVAPIDVVYLNNTGLSTINKLTPLKPVRYEPHKSQMLKPVNEPIGSVNLLYGDVVAKPADSDLRYSEMIYEERERREEEEKEMRKMFFSDPINTIDFLKLQQLKKQTATRLREIFKEEWRADKRADKVAEFFNEIGQSTQALQSIGETLAEMKNEGMDIPNSVYEILEGMDEHISRQQTALHFLSGLKDDEILEDMGIRHDAGDRNADKMRQLSVYTIGQNPPGRFSEFSERTNTETLMGINRASKASEALQPGMRRNPLTESGISLNSTISNWSRMTPMTPARANATARPSDIQRLFEDVGTAEEKPIPPSPPNARWWERKSFKEGMREDRLSKEREKQRQTELSAGRMRDIRRRSRFSSKKEE